MSYVAVKRNSSEDWDKNGKNGNEIICEKEPFFYDGRWQNTGRVFEIPKGSIEKLIGKKLTWEDEPVELKEKYIRCRCGKSGRTDAMCLECGERASEHDTIGEEHGRQ